MFVQEEANEANVPALGLYTHVPFCSTTCDFRMHFTQRETKLKRVSMSFFLV